MNLGINILTKQIADKGDKVVVPFRLNKGPAITRRVLVTKPLTEAKANTAIKALLQAEHDEKKAHDTLVATADGWQKTDSVTITE